MGNVVLEIKEKELRREQLLEKKFITEKQFINTVSYEFWCYRNHPPSLREKNEKRIMDEYLKYIQDGKLVIQ